MVWPSFKVFWLSKDDFTGAVKGKRKRGRQKKRCKDLYKELTGMDFVSSTRTDVKQDVEKRLSQIHLWCPNDHNVMG